MAQSKKPETKPNIKPVPQSAPKLELEEIYTVRTALEEFTGQLIYVGDLELGFKPFKFVKSGFKDLLTGSVEEMSEPFLISRQQICRLQYTKLVPIS